MFQAAYDEKTRKNFIYAEGNGNLYKVAEKCLRNSVDDVYVYIDTVPGNRDIIRIYNKLKKLARMYDGRLIVLPIVCSEYYFIKSIYGSHLILDTEEVSNCVNKGLYFDSRLLSGDDEKKLCTNFEKYCKLILMKNIVDCARHSRKKENGDNNEMYGVYYTHDCQCYSAKKDCIDDSLICKSIQLLSQYPCVPAGILISGDKLIFKDEVYAIHQRLVDEYNEMMLRYKSADSNHEFEYKKITYL